MTQLEMDLDVRLSYSSARLLQGCEQRYWHYKVNKTEIDSDCEEDYSHFKIGTSFHYILEMSEHQKPEKIGAMLEYCVQELGLDEKDVALVHAMVIKYLRLRKKQNMECIKCEYEITDDQVIGFVDLIEWDLDTGLWWISDLKTAKSFWATTTSRLPQDRQLNLYASYYVKIAEDLKLPITKFGGCRYKVTTKSTAKQKARESYNEYVMRMADSYIKSYDVIVPKEKLHMREVYDEHLALQKRSLELRQGEAPTRNFGYCETYFKPCPYWSNCHGGNFTEMKTGLEVIEEI